MRTNNYNSEKIIDSLNSKGYTNFLTNKELMEVTCHLSKKEYSIYRLYKDSNKAILYKKTLPEIKLFKINSKVPLRHQDILGTIFSLGINEDTFGDIVKYNEEFYLFLLPHLTDYFIYNLTNIKNNEVELEEVSLDISDNFFQSYKSIQIIVSSLRIDNIVSSITNKSRNNVIKLFKDNEVVLNYSDYIKPTRTLRENDIFSIRHYGKYRFSKILKETKKGGYIVEILQYI